MRKIRVGTLVFTLILPVLVGMLSAALTSKGMAVYGTMDKPPLSPPAWVFPVAWTILYLMMGLASYFIIETDGDHNGVLTALLLYAFQLVLNFMWSVWFFNFGFYLVAFIWLVVLWAAVLGCTILFFRISKIAGLLMIPYMLWLTFAGYLNLGAYILNTKG